MPNRSAFKIEVPGPVAIGNAKVYYTGKDGTFCDVSDAVRAIDMRADIGELILCRIEVIVSTIAINNA